MKLSSWVTNILSGNISFEVSTETAVTCDDGFEHLPAGQGNIIVNDMDGNQRSRVMTAQQLADLSETDADIVYRIATNLDVHPTNNGGRG